MYKVDYKIKNSVNPCKLSNVKLGGRIGEKYDKVIYERLTSEYAVKEVFGECESAFVNCVDGDDAPVGIWQGEFWGKQILSACRAYKYNGDEKLRNFIKESVYRVMSHQRDDGYLGTYKDEKQIFSVSTEIGYKKRGWDCDWTWNIWCRKYTLWAMLEAYEILQDKKILNSCEKSMDQLIAMLDEIGARICETGTMYGQASGSILKPILILYRYTGNEKYLDFAIEIANEWEDDDTACTKLITKALSKTPIHEWGFDAAEIVPKSKYNPYVEKGKPVFDIEHMLAPEYSGKVYEMQSCFDGLLELYRVTGTERYLTAVISFFELMLKYEFNSICSVGFNDRFIAASRVQDSISELCDAIHFIRLATELNRITGEARYMDYAELCFYNAFLAGVSRDGKWGARGVRASEGNMYAYLQAGFTKNHCCVNNMPRGFANIAESVACSNDDCIYVNLYSEADVKFELENGESVNISIGNGYLQERKVNIKINAELKCNKILKLRIPQWSANTSVSIGEKTYFQNCAGYFETELKNGETIIDICFDSSARIVSKQYNSDLYPITPYHKRRYFNNDVHEDTLVKQNMATVFAGPCILSLSQELGSTKEEVFRNSTIYDKKYSVKLKNTPKECCNCCFEAEFSNDVGDKFTVPMCDFASAADTTEFKDYRYSIFI